MGSRSSKVADYHIVVTNGCVESVTSTEDNSQELEQQRARPAARRETMLSQSPTKPTKGRPQSAAVSNRKRETIVTLQRTGSQGTALTRGLSGSNLLALDNRKDDIFGIECSPQYPWLMKKASLSNMPLKLMDFGKVIGKGYMGTVRLCKTKKGQHFVLKSVKKDFIIKHHSERHVANEKLVLSALVSPFCVRSFGHMADKNHIYIAMEYVAGGELHRLLRIKRQFLPDEAKFYITEVFCALEHVHSLGFVYRDLKPENVAIDEQGHIKLLDFGFACPYSATTRLRTNCGTPAYLSPEQLDGKLTNGYTHVIDWWAYGVVLFELLTGRTPFSSKTSDSSYEIFLRILKNKISYPRSMDKDAKSLISSLCNNYVENRLCSAEDIKKHAYYTVPWKAVYEKRLVPPFIPQLNGAGDLQYFDVK